MTKASDHPPSDRPKKAVARHRIELVGVLTRAQLEAAIAGARVEGAKPDAIVVDCRKMIDYELDARHAFVAWIREVKPKRVAILTDRVLWRMVISGMSLASKVPMQWFATEAEAETWLDG